MAKYILIAFVVWLTGIYVLANEYEVGSIRNFNELETISTDYQLLPGDSEESTKLSDSEAKMDAIKESIIKEKRFTSQLDSASFLSLPIGLSYSTDENPDYFIIIDKATIHPQYAEFNAFMSIRNPIDGKIIRFRAKNIQFSFKSGLTNGFRLELVSKVKTKLGENSSLFWQPGSFVNWDCNGFKSLGINASVELDKNKFVKVEPQTGKELGVVTTSFFITATSLNDLLLELSFEPFKVKGFEEAYFSFKKLTLDFSDTQNAIGFKLPEEYPGEFTGEMAKLWKGFYVHEAQVFLSKKFNSRQGNVTTFYATDVFLDDFGLTGEFGVDDLLTYEQGKLGDWNMSIINFNLIFFTGDFKSLGLQGGVIVEGIEDPLEYEAYYDAGGEYHFGVTPGGGVDFDIFSAKVNLLPCSSITVKVEQEEFQAVAMLHGDITFSASKNSESKNTLVSIPKVDFEGLMIATEAPHFDINSVQLASEDENQSAFFNGFPISITEVAFTRREGDEAVFTFGVAVNLIPSDELGFSGETDIGIVASISEGEWSYLGVEVSNIFIEASVAGAFEISGQMMIADGDPTYGDGFRGAIKANFIGQFEMEAVVVFGKVNGFRYFFVDAFYTSSTGIPAGPFMVSGLGGGVFYKMRQGAAENPDSEFGKSLSDINYVPDESIFLGLKVGVKGGIVNPSVVDAKLSLEVSFTSSMGIALIGFVGEANMLQPPDFIPKDAMKKLAAATANGETPKVPSSCMMVKLSMVMDFQNDAFHAEMEMYLNIAGAIKGSQKNNLAGSGVMHIDPDKWYLHLGTPTSPIGVNYIGLMETNSYFMAGHDIPDAMMMNQRVLEILNMSQEDFNGERKEGELITGKGLAFGTNFELDTGDLTFMVFFARFNLGGGYDVMLLDYGPNAFCKGKSGSIGINGWFAKGQAYAYFAGKIGIKVKVFGKRKKFDIINLQAAAAIRIEGPNPTWMKGVVGGRYRILGGMVKGDCKFEAVVGEKCELRTIGDLSDLEIIADLTPDNDANDVDLFTMPQGVFNMPVDKVIQIAEDPELTKTFKINLNEFAIIKEDGSEYPGEIEWNGDKTTLAYRMNTMFYPNTKYKIVAKVSFDEFVDNKWQQYKGDDGKVYYETKEYTFTTGALPERIPDEVVTHTYPVNRMVNFYKDEHNVAYVLFNMDIAPFFDNTGDYLQKARWTQVNGTPTYTSLRYNPVRQTVEAEIPNLNNEKVYKLELVHVPAATATNVDRNVTENTQTVIGNEGNADMELVTRSAEGVVNDGEEKTFYDLDFRCSKYNKFLDKWPESELKVSFRSPIAPAIEYPGVIVNTDELYGLFEIKGTSTLLPLIRIEAVLNSADWYNSTYGKMIYNNYPIHEKARIDNRTISDYGVPPLKPIWIYQTGNVVKINENNIQTGTFNFVDNRYDIYYGLPSVWANDYLSIRNNLVNLLDKKIISQTKSVEDIIKTYPWPQLGKGNYPIRVSYNLPGINKTTSSKVVNLRNDFENTQFNIYD